MGLLDGFLGQGWDDPKSQAVMALSGGLLSGNMGQGMRDYGAVMAGAPDVAMKRKIMQAELEMKQLAEKRAQATFAMQQDAYGSIDGGGMGGNLGQFSPGRDSNAMQQGGGPGAPNLPIAGAGGGMGGGDKLRQLEKMAIAGVPGAKELFEIYKYKNDPMKLEQGSTYENRVTGKREFMAKIGEGIGPDGAGNYGALPGYAGAQASIEGAKASAIEGAKAQLDPFTMTPKGASNPVLTNRKAVMTSSQPGMMGAGFSGGSRDAANAESIVMMQAELRDPKMSQSDKSGILREISRLQQESGIRPAAGLNGAFELQSEAEKVGQVDTAKANVVRDTGKLSDAKRYGQLQATADRAIELLKAGPTASGIGSLVDSAANFVGASTKGADTAAELNTLSGWMTANVPRMEGPQSDKDVAQYRIMAGALGDKTLPISQRLAAGRELKLLQDKYADLNGYAAKAAAPEAAKPPAMQPPQGAVNTLKLNPKLRDAFDQKYGDGAAARVLGK